MNFTQADLPHIKWSLFTLLLILAIGGSAVYVAQKYAVNAKKNRLNAEQQLRDARNKLNSARDDLQNMSTYLKEFSAIQQRGIIGNEERLALIEDLDNLRRRNIVLDFKYGIAPQQSYKPQIMVDSGNFEMKQSPMTLQLELLHEGQLLRFFDRLRNDVNGWFILDKCDLERNPGTTTLKADCSGGWLTLKNRNAP